MKSRTNYIDVTHNGKPGKALVVSTLILREVSCYFIPEDDPLDQKVIFACRKNSQSAAYFHHKRAVAGIKQRGVV